MDSERISALEQRVAVLESKINDGLKSLEALIDTRFQHMEDVIDGLTFSVNELKTTVQELNEKVIASKVKYNGYQEKFATKLELRDLENKIESIVAEEIGVDKYLGRWGTVFAILSSLTAIFLALKALGF